MSIKSKLTLSLTTENKLELEKEKSLVTPVEAITDKTIIFPEGNVVATQPGLQKNQGISYDQIKSNDIGASFKARVNRNGEITDFQPTLFKDSFTSEIDPTKAIQAANAVETILIEADAQADPVSTKKLGVIRDRIIRTPNDDITALVKEELQSLLIPPRIGAFGPILAMKDLEVNAIRQKNPKLASLENGITDLAAYVTGQKLRRVIPELAKITGVDPTILAQGFPAQAPDTANIIALWNGLVEDGTLDANDPEGSFDSAVGEILFDGETITSTTDLSDKKENLLNNDETTVTDAVDPDKEDENFPGEPPVFQGEPTPEKMVYAATCSFERREALQTSSFPGPLREDSGHYPVYCVTSTEDQSVFAGDGDEYNGIDVTYQRYGLESLRTPENHVRSSHRIVKGYKQDLNKDIMKSYVKGIRSNKSEEFTHMFSLSEAGKEANKAVKAVLDNFETIKEKAATKGGEILAGAAGERMGRYSNQLADSFVNYVLVEWKKTYEVDVFPSIIVKHKVRWVNGEPLSTISVLIMRESEDEKRMTEVQIPERVQYKNGKAIILKDGKVLMDRDTRYDNGHMVLFKGASNDKGLRLPAPMPELSPDKSSCVIWPESGRGAGLHVIVAVENKEKTRKALVALRAVVRLVPDNHEDLPPQVNLLPA